MLSQKDSNGFDHPVAYYSKKLDKHQRQYSTIEKEALALLLALKHFEVYVGSGLHTLQVFTDHNPLTFVFVFVFLPVRTITGRNILYICIMCLIWLCLPFSGYVYCKHI